MENGTHQDADALFKNRKEFLKYNRFKIDRTLKTLSDIDRLIFAAVPRLLHVHQEGLPGYFESEDPVPCGIHNFKVDKESQIATEKLFPDIVIRRNEDIQPVIHCVLLMGSVGSIAQTTKSDLDYTLLIDKSYFTPESRQLFQKKLNLIEQWTWDNFNLETHFFINDFNEVKNNNFGESDSESTGSALAILLKEEMFRTTIIVNGKIPFWWIVPLDTDDDKYEQLLALVMSNETLLKKEEFIDIGNVHDISQGEFFGGSIWALIKSFKSPFKTLMKMGLLEEYMFGDTASNLLCHEVKKRVFAGDTPYIDIDAYLILFDRVQKFFAKDKTDNEVDALRSAFYLKVGTKVSTEDFETPPKHWKKALLVKMMKEWGWTPLKVEQLNQYGDWQMMQKVALGNRVNKILMASYKNISEVNKNLDPSESLITEKDTHLLGRKLFSFFRKAPNKVENLTAMVDGKTFEKNLTILCEKSSAQERPQWYLIRGRTMAFIEHVPKDDVIKNFASYQAMIAFVAFNKLYVRGETELLLRAEGQTIKEDDIRHLMEKLSGAIDSINIAAISNEELMIDAKLKKLFIAIDFGSPLPREIETGNIKACTTNEELNQFIHKQLEHIRSLTATYMTSWGELFSKTYSGVNCMARMIGELSPQTLPESTDNPEFLKVFVHSGRRDEFTMPWIKNYVARAMKARSTAKLDKVAS
ncbi:MAG: adenylate cyclase [Candidatus Nitrohelix vancouverensis]|uniref:Adenylate cyclase n=1 Tax=Candidatus Nitrohelix vancouverensis TaxID=2705534 RepID=A0A7T0C3X8_9BACT|nr:MAG: adenylate cyclase [Candidatus Nitrohelix vancouverensis]